MVSVDRNAAFLKEGAGLSGLAIEEGINQLLGFVFLLLSFVFVE